MTSPDKFFLLLTRILILTIVTTSATAQTVDSLDFKIGQMIMIGMPGPEVDSAVLEEVRAGKAGAIIFFEKNIPKTNSVEGLRKLAATYQSAAPVKLLIGIDQEGGKVNRLKEIYGFPKSITAAAIGKSKSLDTARYYAASTAANLARLGINVNFAPVVDLAVEPNNPAIVKPQRSYSANPDTVIMFAREVIKQHRKQGIITVLKHFPGHGSTKDDTHLGMADVTNTWTEKELKPYRVLIHEGSADAVMSAHIVNKKLDPKGYPGTLSKPILDGILRKKLGFNGVVFSDDMQMHAITKQYGTEEAVRMAINAGIDIMCFSNNIPGSEQRTVDKVHAIIKGFVADGKISRTRIDQSYHRIMALKRTLK